MGKKPSTPRRLRTKRRRPQTPRSHLQRRPPHPIRHRHHRIRRRHLCSPGCPPHRSRPQRHRRPRHRRSIKKTPTSSPRHYPTTHPINRNISSMKPPTPNNARKENDLQQWSDDLIDRTGSNKSLHLPLSGYGAGIEITQPDIRTIIQSSPPSYALRRFFSFLLRRAKYLPERAVSSWRNREDHG